MTKAEIIAEIEQYTAMLASATSPAHAIEILREIISDLQSVIGSTQ